MKVTHASLRSATMAAFGGLLLAACQDAVNPAGPAGPAPVQQSAMAPGAHAPAQVADWFTRAAPEVLALPQTVYADHDEATNQLVFAVEHARAIPAVAGTAGRLGLPASAYRIVISEPFRFLNGTLQSAHRPTMGGIQIHFSSWICTLGFNVDVGGVRSFIMNSHCTDQQGKTGSTVYYQPSSSSEPSAIATEADDPAYFKDGICPRGRKCRYSDAARARYIAGVQSIGLIAKTEGANTGSVSVTGSFSITAQDEVTTTFNETLHKVGRTTGWTSGPVPAAGSCVMVNVLGSNITLICQTLVTAAVGAGDSGSPVFRVTGGDNVTLVGILWGGNMSDTQFIFSPFASIIQELSNMTAVGLAAAANDGGGGGGGGGDEPSCPPKSNSPRCR